jgi:hypothetical protein
MVFALTDEERTILIVEPTVKVPVVLNAPPPVIAAGVVALQGSVIPTTNAKPQLIVHQIITVQTPKVGTTTDFCVAWSTKLQLASTMAKEHVAYNAPRVPTVLKEAAAALTIFVTLRTNAATMQIAQRTKYVTQVAALAVCADPRVKFIRVDRVQRR